MGSGTDDPDFLEAMAGVDPLTGGPTRVRRPPEPGRDRASISPPKLPRFDVRSEGERVEGLSDGASRRSLRDLRSKAPERRIDLHGLREAEARAATLDELAAMRRRGEARLLVIHGRGRRSPAGPVLKEALVGWLTGEPAGRWVSVFCSAPPALGGVGATLVGLRRQKRRRR